MYKWFNFIISMKQKTKKNLTYWLGVIVVGIALGLALQFVRAWTEPSAAPPGGNVGAPINTSVNVQTKQGGLNIGGKLKIGNDSQPDSAGQMRFNGSDYEGYTPSTGWVSFTATGGGGGGGGSRCIPSSWWSAPCQWCYLYEDCSVGCYDAGC